MVVGVDGAALILDIQLFLMFHYAHDIHLTLRGERGP